MTSMRQGSIHLFRIAGVDVFLHWSWFLVAAFEISGRTRTYSSLSWNILEYLALFSIVLLHEYGHALACRQVGGIANRIVLWPLGGVAYVDPPRGYALEHRGWTAGECRSVFRSDTDWHVRAIARLVRGGAQYPHPSAGNLVHQPGFADL